MIEVFNLMAEGKIEEETKLIVPGVFEEFEYKYLKRYRNFVDEYFNELEERFNINGNFLNREVHLEQPKEYKYRIKLPYSNVYVGFAFNEYGEKEIIPYSRDSISELILQLAEKNGLMFKTQFMERDLVEIKEMQPYEQFKALVKDDENE